MLDYAITPFVGGVYAGNPDQLSVRYGFPKLFNLEQDHRSLILGSLARRRERRRAGTLYRTRLVSFPDGLQALPRQLADGLREPVRLSTPVSGLDYDGQWHIRFGETSSSETVTADAVVLALPATAQSPYPSKPVRLVVNFPAGGPADLLARTIGEYLQRSLNQPFVVENKAGAGGNVGATDVARSPADGYSLMVGIDTAFTVNPHIYDNMAFKPGDLKPVVE